MILKLIKFVMWICEKLNRVEYIQESRSKQDSQVYLVRYIVCKTEYFKFYIHRFLRSDLDDLHDHPWNFGTFIVQGGYTEIFYNGPAKTSREMTCRLNKRSVSENRLVFRKGEDFHRVILDKEYTIDMLEEAPLTLFVSFQKYKEWGFMTSEGWVHWKTYLGLDKAS